MLRKFIILILILAAAAGGAYWYYWYEEKHKSDDIILFGNVDVRQVDLGFRVAGRVDKMFFQEGDFVPAGSLMGVLDKQPYLDDVRQNKANIESINASFKNAQILLERRQELIGDGSISQEDLDNSQTNALVLEANLKTAKAALAIAMTNYSFTEVYAPTDGIVLTRIREPGTVVKVGDPIYTLSIISPVWVRAYVPEQLLGVVYPGMNADIYTDTKNGKVYPGRIGFISPMAEFTPKTVETTQLRTDLVYRLRIYADSPDLGLRQGMPVTVKLHPKKTSAPLPKESLEEPK